MIPARQNSDDAREFLVSCRALIDSQLDLLIPKESDEPQRVHAAIRWSVFAGGKRFRPGLLLATGQTFGASPDDLLSTACALEMIHTYSLIHDDLPSMDDDDLRRGRPTCHIKFGEDVAILAGDGLYAEAFRLLLRDQHGGPALVLAAAAELAAATGVDGMVGGQYVDVAIGASNPE